MTAIGLRGLMLANTGVPAKAGTHLSAPEPAEGWVPAFAGTTEEIRREAHCSQTGLP